MSLTLSFLDFWFILYDVKNKEEKKLYEKQIYIFGFWFRFYYFKKNLQFKTDSKVILKMELDIHKNKNIIQIV